MTNIWYINPNAKSQTFQIAAKYLSSHTDVSAKYILLEHLDDTNLLFEITDMYIYNCMYTISIKLHCVYKRKIVFNTIAAIKEKSM